jgi:hypothetical protein
MVHPICPPRLRCPHWTRVCLAALTRRVKSGLWWARMSGVRSWGTGNPRVARGHRQPCRFPVLPPLHLGQRLTLRTGAIATGMIGVPRKPPGGTGFGVPAELRRPAGLESVHHLLRRGRDGMRTAVALPIEAEDLGDFPPWGAGQSLVCGGIERLRRGPGWVPAGQEVAWAAARRQRLAGDPEIPGGGIERLRPQPPLDRPDIAPRFQQVGRTTMAQRMEAVAGRDACGPLRVIVDFLGCADGHRRVGIEARQQPRRRSGELPVGAQGGQQAGGEQRGTILAPCARFDPDQPALTCNVRALQADDCTDAQARGLGRHQEHTVSGVFGARG